MDFILFLRVCFAYSPTITIFQSLRFLACTVQSISLRLAEMASVAQTCLDMQQAFASTSACSNDSSGVSCSDNSNINKYITRNPNDDGFPAVVKITDFSSQLQSFALYTSNIHQEFMLYTVHQLPKLVLPWQPVEDIMLAESRYEFLKCHGRAVLSKHIFIL
jgi:hypothetical protein